MSTCPKCGMQNQDGEFCINCGASLQQDQYRPQSYQQSSYQQPAYQQPTYQQPAYQQPVYNAPPQPSSVNVVNVQQSIPPEYQPLSPWAYFGYDLLFSIPIVGFILLIVFSFSSGNINRRNYARSFFCIYAIIAIIAIVAVILAVAGYSVFSVRVNY